MREENIKENKPNLNKLNRNFIKNDEQIINL